jgi:hypothetical protein
MPQLLVVIPGYALKPQHCAVREMFYGVKIIVLIMDSFVFSYWRNYTLFGLLANKAA